MELLDSVNGLPPADVDLASAVILDPPMAPHFLRIEDATGVIEVSVADVALVLDFVRTAGPVIEALVELLPVAAGMMAGGPGGLMGALGAMLRGGSTPPK